MSEFKFACPVCGQHMMCDASHGGQVMECPTCFQKITAPQAPAADGKFILTGTKVTEKKISARGLGAAGPAAAEKKFPAAILVGVIVLVLAAGAGVYFFGGKLFHFGPAAGWQTRDIGAVRAAGAFSLDKGVFTVSGSGADIWDQADSFRYVFQTLNGDGTLTARVLKIKNTDPWAKAGVMARESPEANSKYAAVLVTPSSGIAFQQRDRPGAVATEVLHLPNLAPPYWVRLVRQANTFTAYASVNGTAWTKLGSTTIAMGSQLDAGLAACAHANGTLGQAQFDNVNLQTNTNAGPPPPAPPAPKLIAPPANDTNWTLTLDAAVIPDAPVVVGRIHGQDFIAERAYFQNGTLALRAGARGPMESGVLINFSGAPPEALAGKTINVSADAEKAAQVSLFWKDATGVQKASFDVGYALRLEFGAVNKGRLPGKIYLCLPDAEKSYLMGKFTAAVIKPKPATPPPAK